jgi:hypothetical protein
VCYRRIVQDGVVAGCELREGTKTCGEGVRSGYGEAIASGGSAMNGLCAEHAVALKCVLCGDVLRWI